MQNRKKELTVALVEREKDEPLLGTFSFEKIEDLAGMVTSGAISDCGGTHLHPSVVPFTTARVLVSPLSTAHPTLKTKTNLIHSLTLVGTAVGLLAAGPDRASAQNVYVVNEGSNAVGEYNSGTGAAVSNPLISGLDEPLGLALAGGNLYVANYGSNTVAAFNSTTGAPTSGFTTINTGSNTLPFDVLASNGMLYVSTIGGGTVTGYNAATGLAAPSFTTITGLSNPTGLALLGTTLYVSDRSAGTVRTYNAQTGALINAGFLSGFSYVNFLTASGGTLYVADQNSQSVQAFNATTGATLTSFMSITGLNSPDGIAVSGNELFVANFHNNTLPVYDATTGTLIDSNLIPGLNEPSDLAFSVPEPSTWALLGAGAATLGLTLRRQRRRVRCV